MNKIIKCTNTSGYCTHYCHLSTSNRYCCHLTLLTTHYCHLTTYFCHLSTSNTYYCHLTTSHLSWDAAAAGQDLHRPPGRTDTPADGLRVGRRSAILVSSAVGRLLSCRRWRSGGGEGASGVPPESGALPRHDLSAPEVETRDSRRAPR